MFIYPISHIRYWIFDKVMEMHGHNYNWGPGAGAAHTWRMRFGQRGWLRPTVLKILEEKPMNSIEVMNAIQEMSNGWWRPSPGSIYPLLESLANESLIKKNEEGRYELTARYSRESGPQEEGDDIITSIESDVSYLEELASTDKEKFAKYGKRIEKITARLSKLK